ncbi:MAG: hypothetical protein ACLTE2_06175 [Eubacteriales bacterium]
MENTTVWYFRSWRIYGELTYGKKAMFSAEISMGRERTVVVNRILKTMTGWRLGWLALMEIIDPMTRLHQYAISRFSNRGTIRCNRSFEKRR